VRDARAARDVRWEIAVRVKGYPRVAHGSPRSIILVHARGARSPRGTQRVVGVALRPVHSRHATKTSRVRWPPCYRETGRACFDVRYRERQRAMRSVKAIKQQEEVGIGL
jgi:hypothetical protein